MNEKITSVWPWVAQVLLTIAVTVVTVGLVGSNQPDPTNPSLGAFGSRFPNGIAIGTNATVDTAGAFSIGNDGTQLVEVIHGSCNAKTTALTHGASSTKPYFCDGITGVTSGDTVLVALPRTILTSRGSLPTIGNFGDLIVTTAYATTTGVIGFDILNFLGDATSSIAQATTGVEFWVVR